MFLNYKYLLLFFSAITPRCPWNWRVRQVIDVSDFNFYHISCRYDCAPRFLAFHVKLRIYLKGNKQSVFSVAAAAFFSRLWKRSLFLPILKVSSCTLSGRHQDGLIIFSPSRKSLRRIPQPSSSLNIFVSCKSPQQQRQQRQQWLSLSMAKTI